MSKVLLIDDDAIFTDVIAHRLQQEGIECTYAPQGSVALDLLKHHDLPDLILLDIVMPDMSGFELLAKLKVEHSAARIPVIMFSNDATEENKKRALELGANEFLEKVQMTPSEVVEHVRRFIVQA